MKFAAKIRPWFRDLDGWWYVTRRVNGKRVQQKLVKGRENEEAAFKQFYQLMAASGAVEVTSDATFNELAYLFLAWSRQHNDDQTTAWYLHFISSFDAAFNGRVRDLRKSHVEDWLGEHDWSVSTRRQAITCVKRVVNWAYEENKIPEIPEGLRKLRRPKMGKRDRVLAPDEHEKIVANTDQAFARFLFALRETGARPGEVRTVTMKHVDLKLGVWVFEEHKTSEKTQKARTIYLTPAMLKLTAELIKQHPSGPLFLNSRGKPWTANAIRCRMRNLRKKLGLPAGTVAYSYRHTYATDGLERGVPIAEMAELLGHTDTRMVSEHYGHLSQKVQHMRNAAQKASGPS